MTRVAAVDCGTNSIRLLIADVTGDGLRDVVRTMRVVRLGQGVDRTGQLDPQALERTFAAIDDYAQLCEVHRVEGIRFVATSATRDASNRDQFVAGVRSRLGVEPEVVSGAQEAALSFRGALSAVQQAPGPYTVVDLGGGSTEVVWGTSAPEATWSMDVGCVRMTERHLSFDPPAAAHIDAAVADIHAALDEAAAHVPWESTGTLVGLAGSITTVTAHALGLDSYERSRINGAVVSIDEVVESCTALVRSSRPERAAMGFMHPGRVDVIGAGALVWREVAVRIAADARRAGTPLETTLTSEHDILDGIALSAAERITQEVTPP